ncbi:olfactomedin-4-like [Hyperolius riggenbachi]|uniref:olfactomedin-4-like n=1 Tax=Hyperolius riggenbachi TaxID=752182 RepID=UPI0035A2FFF2
MLSLIILFLSIQCYEATSLVSNSTGSLDENGVCHCTVVLPDTTFPADRLENLENANHNLTIVVKEESTKIQIYESTLVLYMDQLKDLAKRVQIMELGGISYTELDFELIKLEIQELEALIMQLKTSLNGSNTIVETLYQEIHNISIMVGQLEIYDKNNVLVIRREVAALQKRLEECQQNHTRPNVPALPPGDYGSCKHGLISNISKPYLVQQNLFGSSYKYGGWGKDSKLKADQNRFWVAPLNTDGRIMEYIYLYASYNDLLIYKHNTYKRLPSNRYGQGGGMIMFNNGMYYNCYNSRNICKYNLNTDVLEQAALKDAAYNNRFSYSSTSYQDIDLTADEDGLWVLYATEEMGGKIIISQIDATTLELKQTWTTSIYKPGISNAFMACGVLYATRTYNTKTEEIFYMYDTNTGKEGNLNILVEKMAGTMHSLSYNPNEHMLYMYNDGFLVSYYVTFMAKKNL